VNIALSSSHRFPGSVALNVMVSVPYQSGSGVLIVAIRLMSIEIVRSVFPVYVQLIWSSELSMSVT